MVNVHRRLPAPPCLSQEKEKADGDYKCGETLEYLIDMFHNKCYICEYKHPTSINVEHFKPHKGNKDLKFDWNNLFLACSHCNNTKLAKPEFDDILDCTDPNDRVEEWIHYEMRPFPMEKVIITAEKNDQRVAGTARLLDSVYNGHTPLKLLESVNLRKSLLSDLLDFQNCLLGYFDDDSEEAEKRSYLQKLKRHLKNQSAFCAFKRWIVRDNPYYFNEFSEFID